MAAFQGAIERALKAAVEVDRNPVKAVHELRRNVRRARALFRVVERKLPTAAALEIEAGLRGAIRETGELRDRDVLPATLATLAVKRGTAEARAEVEALLVAERVAQCRPRARARRLAAVAARLALLLERFLELFPEDFDLVALGQGLERMHRRARKAIRAAAAAPSDVAMVHAGRKRLRELVFAIEPFGSRTSRLGRRVAKLARLSTRLGATLDLDGLSTFVRQHGATLPAPSAERLLLQLDRQIARRRPPLLGRARRVLAPERWVFSRLLPSLVKGAA